MYLRYGNFTHELGEVTVSIQKQTLESEGGVPYEVVHTWSVQGRVFGDTVAEVVQKFVAIERAYARWFQTAQLVAADGTVCHTLPNAGSTTGVKVVQPPSYPDGSGAQLATFRDYALTLQAHYPAAGRPLVKSWVETVTLSGGLPDRRVVETLNTPPVAYLGRRRTAFRATQAGQAVGYFAYPPVPPPLFGLALLEGADHPVSRTSPRTREGRLVDWPVSWSYRFASPLPLVGLPTVLPSG